MGMKISGVESVLAMITQDADKAVDAARKQMTRAAERIQEEARLNAPVDTHRLEDSIQIDSPRTARSQLKEITVFVDPSVEYAELVHERYGDPGGPAGTHGPGEGTLEKMRANPGRLIGKKFLDRAARKVEDDYEARVRAAVKSAI